MTFKEKAIDLMFQNGMFKEDAEKVFAEKIAKDPANDAMQNRWNDDISGYPPQMVNIIWFSVKTNALEWIEQNQPKAWYKACFE